MVLAYPPGREWHQRQPEQKVQVGPQDQAIHTVDRVKQMVMVVPVDGDVHEAEH
jgi:hypothetical protein